MFRLIPAIVLAALLPGVAHAQQPRATAPAAVLADTAGPLAAPAEFVLRNREALALTPAQVGSLEKLAAALRDSTVARRARTREMMMSNGFLVRTTQFEWSGPIDEAGIRENARRQSERQAVAAIEMARDRRAVGALLTPAQIARVEELEREEMLTRARRLRGGG